MPKYKIKAAAFRIPIPFFRGRMIRGRREPLHIPCLEHNVHVPWVTHNFWLLVKEEEGKEEEIAAAHALATRITTDPRTGTPRHDILPIGEFNDFLKIWIVKNPELAEEPDSPKPYWLPAHEEDQRVMYGDLVGEDDALKRWKRLKSAVYFLNSCNVHYSAFGMGLDLGIFSATINSNSGYRAMGMIMELPIYFFPHCQPGIHNTMIPEKDLIVLIEALKAKENASEHNSDVESQRSLVPSIGR